MHFENPNRKYSNPYDQHLPYKQSLQNMGPRFFLRTYLTMKMMPQNPLRTLDVGCGDGSFIEILFAHGINADGIDGSKKAIKICKDRLRNSSGKFECCFIEEFCPKTPYNLLICGEVLEHIEEDDEFLVNLHRLCSPNGSLVLSVPLDMRLWSKADEQAGHFRRYSKEALLGKLCRIGFFIDDYVVWGYPMVRYFTSIIRKYQTQLLTTTQQKELLQRNKKKPWIPLLQYFRYLFLFDNLFNFTEKGVGIIVRASKN